VLAAPCNQAGLEFNLSHSGDRALVAVSVGIRIGVDIEQTRPEYVSDELAALFFSSREQSDLAAIPAHRRIQAFFKCWTSKEAYIKGLGLGLSVPLRDFDVSVDPDKPVRLLRPYAADSNCDSWALVSVEVGLSYTAVLAADKMSIRLIYMS
jgi:4'-phosphopantetheinyl transferase